MRRRKSSHDGDLASGSFPDESYQLPVFFKRRKKTLKTSIVLQRLAGLFAAAFVLAVVVVVPPSTSNIPSSPGLISSLPKNTTSWLEVRETLCPRGKYPNVALGQTLFEIAANELKDQNSVDKEQGERVSFFSPFRRSSSKSSVLKFYHGAFGERQGDGISNLPLYDLSSSTTGKHEDKDHSSDLLYIRIWKCGNDQIRNWLGETFSISHDWKTWWSLPPTTRQKLQWRKQSCIITAIRDPISHFISGYNEIESRWLGRASPRGFTLNDKKTLSNKLSYINYEPGSKKRFEQFVHDLLLSNTPQQAMMDHWVFEHMFAMSRVLSELSRLGMSLTAYLPSLENLARAWPQMLAKHCPQYKMAEDQLGASKELHSMGRTGQHLSSKDPYSTYRAAKSVWEEQGEISKALCAVHAMDYACWRDLSDGIPLLCQEVFKSDSFLQPLREAIETESSNR